MKGRRCHSWSASHPAAKTFCFFWKRRIRKEVRWMSRQAEVCPCVTLCIMLHFWICLHCTPHAHCLLLDLQLPCARRWRKRRIGTQTWCDGGGFACVYVGGLNHTLCVRCHSRLELIHCFLCHTLPPVRSWLAEFGGRQTPPGSEIDLRYVKSGSCLYGFGLQLTIVFAVD